MNYKELTGKRNPFEGLSLDEKRRLVVYLGYVAVPPVPMDEVKRRWGAVLKDDECPTAFEALEMVEIIKREVLAEENIEKESSKKSGCFVRLVFGLLCVAAGIVIGIVAFPYIQQILQQSKRTTVEKPRNETLPTKPQPRKTPMPPNAGQTATITLPGGEKMEMIYCSPGTFIMGSPVSESGRGEDEAQHRVTLTKGFWLGKYKVTQVQWESIMGENPSSIKGFNLPVDGVSWYQCESFVQKIDAELNCGARMPTEAEWEYACRKGDLKECGFVDMHVGAMEWCLDVYEGNYSVRSVTDPCSDFKSRSDPHVCRGGVKVANYISWENYGSKYTHHYAWHSTSVTVVRTSARWHALPSSGKGCYVYKKGSKYPIDCTNVSFWSDEDKRKSQVPTCYGFRLCCSRLPCVE